MDSTGIVDLFRAEVADLQQPFLWSDDEAYAFLDDAQIEFCRRTEGIADARTPSVTHLSVVPGGEWYEKSPLILKVRSATRADTGRQVSVVNIESQLAFGIKFDGATGVVGALIDGMDDGAFRAHPVPNETVTINLAVFRLPIAKITSAGAQALEVASQHHPHLVLWMRHRAYSKQDADAFDPRRAAEYEDKFEKYCAKAKAEQERARRQVGAVVYGGIPMGQPGLGFTNDYGRR